MLHQLLAPALLAGVSEIALSIVLSGLLAMVSFQALALIVYALSGDLVLALGATLVIVVARAADFGVVYPIFLMGTPHTYGSLGLSLVVLIAGLAGAGAYRTAGFLLGVTPAVHASLGLWFALIVAVAVAWDFRNLRTELRPALPSFVAGSGLTALSLLLQYAFTTEAPAIDDERARQYLAAFVGLWDSHRRPIELTRQGLQLNAAALGLAVLWLKAPLTPMAPAARFLLRLVAASAAISLALVFVSWAPPDSLPASALILMPGRLLNVNAMIYAAILFGLIGAGARRTIVGASLVLLLAGGLLVSSRSRVWELIAANGGILAGFLLPEQPTRPVQIMTIATIGLLIALALSHLGRSSASHAWAGMVPRGSARWTRGILRWAALAVFVWTGIVMWQVSLRSRVPLLDRTNDPVFQAASAGQGLLLTGGNLQFVQLRTRRPVLLDGGGLDGLPYAIEAAPAVERILRDVYGLDLFNPPEEARGTGAIPNEANRRTWEQYTPGQWQQIRQTYNVTQVLTRAEWVLALPISARSSAHVLYEIPDPQPR